MDNKQIESVLSRELESGQGRAGIDFPPVEKCFNYHELPHITAPFAIPTSFIDIQHYNMDYE
jgi:hypothetical protein